MSKNISEKLAQKKCKSTKSKLFVSKMDLILITLAVILGGTFFAIGKYFEFNSPGPFDSGSNVYSAAHILAGARIGIEEKPSADEGTLLVNTLGVKLFGFNEFGPKLIQTLMQAAALVLMFIAMRKCFCTLSATVAVIMASIFLSSPLIAKFGNVKEQYMIACMVAGISLFILYKCYDKWFLAVLSGAILVWAPLFKVTGTTAIGALGLYVILQPVLKNSTIKQTIKDILLLFGGAAASMAPMYIWTIYGDIKRNLPYQFAWNIISHFFMKLTSGGTGGEGGGGYTGTSRKLVSFSEQWRIVLRYYSLFLVPIFLSLGAVIARIIKFFIKRKSQNQSDCGDRFVLLLSFWWILDMAFVWISPQSYEQYYLPLNASGAMLGGYLVGLFWCGMEKAAKKRNWIIGGLVGLLVMIMMSWHVFFGISKSPHTGSKYPEKRKGYLQNYREISYIQKTGYTYPWQQVGDYIREHTEPDDKIYVWGWYPGIYVQAQRFSSATKAFSITRRAPNALQKEVDLLLSEFQQEKPKYIVDSRKRHIPTNRPPYELWPIVPKGFLGFDKKTFLPLNKEIIAAYDRQWVQLLRTEFDEDEAIRYEILKPFREFIMNNYKIIGMFGEHVLFELKKAPQQ
ncbi:MAG: glycosyltransferase family 39 protein [Sedimentisphaerales bacterium]|nr:glycosyltransferase family 39 protein [Sedimentisphaerales bacterium]